MIHWIHQFNTRVGGTTLIEVMTAMIVLAVGVLSLAPMMVVSVQGTGRAHDLTLATVQAQTLIESVLALDTIPVVPYEVINIDSSSGLTSTVRVDNSTSDGTVPNGMDRILVQTTWVDKAGVSRLFEYSTYREE